MNEDPLPHLQDTLLRRELTPDEEHALTAWLSLHPEAALAWQEDVRLARAFRQLPDAAVPSNFTVRVLNEVQREVAKTRRARNARPGGVFGWRPLFWIPAATAALAILAIVGGQEWRTQRQQAEFARDITQLRVMAALPPEVLEDFETIQRFGESASPVDFELLAALE